MTQVVHIETLFLSKSANLVIGDDQTGANLCRLAVKLHFSTYGESFYKKSNVLIALNITKASRICMNRKLKTYVRDGDKIWLLTDKEWDRYKKFLEVSFSFNCLMFYFQLSMFITEKSLGGPI